MAKEPQYVGTPKSTSVVLSVSNAALDGTTGTYEVLYTAGASGSRIDRIRANALGTTVAGMLRFFLDDALIKEVPVQAISPSGATPAWAVDVTFDNGLIMESGAVLKCSTQQAESFAVTVINGGDF